MALARAPVPLNVFARDLHKPSINYVSMTEAGAPVEPTVGPEAPSVARTPLAEPKVLEVNAEPPEANQGMD